MWTVRNRTSKPRRHAVSPRAWGQVGLAHAAGPHKQEGGFLCHVVAGGQVQNPLALRSGTASKSKPSMVFSPWKAARRRRVASFLLFSPFHLVGGQLGEEVNVAHLLVHRLAVTDVGRIDDA